MSNKQIVFKRESLYEKVWSVPIARLAKEFGISDVALAKICKKLKVPRPPRGYWAKLEFKKKVRRPPLPDVSHNEPKEFIHHYYPKPEYEEKYNPEIRNSISFKRDIVVPANLDNSHRLVKVAQAILERAKPSENGLLYPQRRACLEVNVSPACLERSLRIMDAAVKGFEAEGFSVAVDGGSKTSSYALINGEKIYFSIAEDYRRFDHVLTQEKNAKKKTHPFWDYKKYDYHPTGNLSLKIELSGAYGSQKNWSDAKTGKLEEKIGEFIGGAVFIAHLLKIERQKREDDKRRWEEERKQREENEKKLAEERARLQQLEEQAALWAKSEQLRAFVQAVEKATESKDFTEEQKLRISAWMAWARKKADQIDPIKRSFPD